MAQKDFYKILQVIPEADAEVISAAYRRLAQKYHPDVNKSRDATTRMQELNEAYEVLSDPNKRAQYDAGRGGQTRTTGPSYEERQRAEEERRRQEAEAAKRKRAEAEAAFRRAQAEEEAAKRKREAAQAAYERATGNTSTNRQADEERRQREEEETRRRNAEAEASRREEDQRRKQENVAAQAHAEEEHKKAVSRRRLLRAAGALGVGALGYAVFGKPQPPGSSAPATIPPATTPATTIPPARIAPTTIPPATIAPATIPPENVQRIELAPNISIEFVRIPAGKFLMGSDRAKDRDAYDDELPQHAVNQSEYWMGRTEVTVAQFTAFVNATGYKANSNALRGANYANHPVTYVSWFDAMAFCEWASQKSGAIIALPTEAQWEKAARGPDGGIYPWGNDAPNANRANFNNNEKGTTPVSKYSPLGDSPYGCADMAGNVWEWCADWYAENTYVARNGGITTSDPAGPDKGQYRVLRGGSYFNLYRFVRCAYRRSNGFDGFSDFGFRVVLRAH